MAALLPSPALPCPALPCPSQRPQARIRLSNWRRMFDAWVPILTIRAVGQLVAAGHKHGSSRVVLSLAGWRMQHRGEGHHTSVPGSQGGKGASKDAWGISRTGLVGTRKVYGATNPREVLCQHTQAREGSHSIFEFVLEAWGSVGRGTLGGPSPYPRSCFLWWTSAVCAVAPRRLDRRGPSRGRARRKP